MSSATLSSFLEVELPTHLSASDCFYKLWLPTLDESSQSEARTLLREQNGDIPRALVGIMELLSTDDFERLRELLDRYGHGVG